MALMVTDECINCDVCEPGGPNDAISMGPEIYGTARARGTECVGHQAEPQCRQVCPVDCIPFDPAWPESPDALMAKFLRLQGSEPAAAGAAQPGPVS